MRMVSSKKVWEVFNQLIGKFGDEFNVLMNVDEREIAGVVGEKMARVIILNREGKLKIKPGYDGVYGEVVLDGDYERKSDVLEKQNLGKDTLLGYF